MDGKLLNMQRHLLERHGINNIEILTLHGEGEVAVSTPLIPEKIKMTMLLETLIDFLIDIEIL